MALTEEIKKLIATELSFSASRSSGPGGQNVNKVNTQVELRFSLFKTFLLNEDEKLLIASKLKNRMNAAGEIIYTSQEGRSQFDNREIATTKFFEAIEKALTIRKRRVKTSPTFASVTQRLETKKKASEIKRLRKPPETI